MDCKNEIEKAGLETVEKIPVVKDLYNEAEPGDEPSDERQVEDGVNLIQPDPNTLDRG